MAFVNAPAALGGARVCVGAGRVCARRTPRAAADEPSRPRNDSSLPPPRPELESPLPPPPAANVTREEATPRKTKLTRNKPGEEVLFAEAYPGEAGGVEVGTGLGPKPTGKTSTGDKRVTRASKAQGSMGFADAWASQNRDRGGSKFDVWAIIGLLFILTPPVIIVVAILTGAIPGFANIRN